MQIHQALPFSIKIASKSPPASFSRMSDICSKMPCEMQVQSHDREGGIPKCEEVSGSAAWHQEGGRRQGHQ